MQLFDVLGAMLPDAWLAFLVQELVLWTALALLVPQVTGAFLAATFAPVRFGADPQ